MNVVWCYQRPAERDAVRAYTRPSRQEKQQHITSLIYYNITKRTEIQLLTGLLALWRVDLRRCLRPLSLPGTSPQSVLFGCVRGACQTGRRVKLHPNPVHGYRR